MVTDEDARAVEVPFGSTPGQGAHIVCASLRRSFRTSFRLARGAAGGLDTAARATAEVDRRLAAYTGIETDPAIVREMERIVRSGLVSQTTLPGIPPLPSGGPTANGPRGRRPNPRRATT